ncbi:MAG: hypothetical protein AMXMBFR33_63190 [Candidatus Xenobia bacterium]
MRRHGHTLVEILVAISILGILTGAILFLYVTGGRAVAQGDMRGELLRQLQLAASRMSREMETSAFDSVSSSASAVAMMSAVPASGGGSPTLSPDGSIIWQKYIVYWHDSATRTLNRREYAVPPTTSAQPIENWQSLTLADYTNGGDVIGREIVAFTVANPVDTRRLEVSMTGEQIFRGEPRQHSLKFAIRFKN